MSDWGGNANTNFVHLLLWGACTCALIVLLTHFRENGGLHACVFCDNFAKYFTNLSAKASCKGYINQLWWRITAFSLFWCWYYKILLCNFVGICLSSSSLTFVDMFTVRPKYTLGASDTVLNHFFSHYLFFSDNI